MLKLLKLILFERPLMCKRLWIEILLYKKYNNKKFINYFFALANPLTKNCDKCPKNCNICETKAKSMKC